MYGGVGSSFIPLSYISCVVIVRQVTSTFWLRTFSMFTHAGAPGNPLPGLYIAYSYPYPQPAQ